MTERLAVVRMAPSPTGYVHLGSARTALFNLLFARSRGGRFVLRVDDTDLERNRPEYERAIYDAFEWLGLEWDEGPVGGGPRGPYRQSERLDIYRAQAARLLEGGGAYRCWCSADELEAERREAERRRVPYRYSRRCLTDPPADRAIRDFVVRLRVPEGETVLEDLVRGSVRFEHSEIGDPILVKSNGYPTYNFASPVDDALMGITHVLRGEEHLPNTPVQLMVLEALGLPGPDAFAHLPVIVGRDHKKLSKRLHPEARLSHFLELGYLPEAMINYLAFLGWNPGTEQEIFSLDELVGAFDIGRVHRGSAMFDWDKLDWIDGQHIRMLSDRELAERLVPYLPSLPESTVLAAAPALKTRLSRLDKARELLAYLDEPPAAPALDETQRAMVAAALVRLRDTEWNPSAIEETLEEIRAANAWSRGKFFTPLRRAVAGGNTPPLHDTLALLPKAAALDRLSRVAP